MSAGFLQRRHLVALRPTIVIKPTASGLERNPHAELRVLLSRDREKELCGQNALVMA